MTVSELRSAPLSDSIVTALIGAVEAYAEWNVLSKVYHNSQAAISSMLDAQDACHHIIAYGGEVDMRTVLQDYCIENIGSSVGRYARVFQSCCYAAMQQKEVTGVLKAATLIKINHALCKADETILKRKDSLYDDLPSVETLWFMLHELYRYKRQYHWLMESAIAFVRFLAFVGDEKLCVPAISILLASVFDNRSTFRGLSMQWTLLTDPRKDFSVADGDEALLHVLTVFEKMWRHHSAMIYQAEEMKNDLTLRVYERCPSLNSPKLVDFLSSRVYTRNREYCERMSVSGKTAIQHLTLLEKNGILYSHKDGRNKYYFNSVYTEWSQRLAEMV